MKARAPLAALATAGLVVGIAACALDFNRFESAAQSKPDAGVRPSTDGADGGNNAPPSDDATVDVTTPFPEQDAEVAPDARADAGRVADASPELSPCTPSSSCLSEAQNCGMGCASQEQQCASRCSGGSCRQNCMRTETMCISQCESTCTNCVQSAGCNATSSCADAAGP
jgi:hypothetical protein